MSFAHVSQMIFNTCFALSDCDGELPESFGFVLLDFKALRRGGRDVQRHLAFGTHFFLDSGERLEFVYFSDHG